MKFIDLNRQYRKLRRHISKALLAVAAEGSFILGERGKKLEARIAEFIGAPYAIGLNSGTDALFLSLKAFDIGHGDEVMTTPFSFIATAEIIANAGAKPVFADIDPLTFNIDPKRIEKKITRKTKAIIPVHLYGQMADMSAIMRIAKKHKLAVIEDAAQALGASQRLNGKVRIAGSIGDAACFSFFPTKNLGAYGDAGMVTTRHTALAREICLLRNHGAQEKYRHDRLGYSSRLDELQAAVLLAKLPHLTTWNRARARLAARYTKAFAGLRGLTVPFVARGNTHIFHQYTIRLPAGRQGTPRRDELKEHLAGHSIPTVVHYPLPLHLQPAFAYLGHKKGDFSEAERAAREVLSLPLYPELKEKEQDRVIRAILSFFA